MKILRKVFTGLGLALLIAIAVMAVKLWTQSSYAAVPSKDSSLAVQPLQGCDICGMYFSDVTQSCNPDGSTHWTAIITNNGDCTVTTGWNANLLVQENYGDYNVVLTVHDGPADFPPGDTMISGDLNYPLPPDATGQEVIVVFDTSGDTCGFREGKSGVAAPCFPVGSLTPTPPTDTPTDTPGPGTPSDTPTDTPTNTPTNTRTNTPTRTVLPRTSTRVPTSTPGPCSPDLDVRQVTISCNPDQTVHFIAKIEHETESTCPVFTVPYTASLQVKIGNVWSTVATFMDSVTVLRGATVFVTGDICYVPIVGAQKERIFFELDPSADPTRGDNLSKTSNEITPCRPSVACEPTPTNTPGGPPETDTPTPLPCSPDLDVRQVTISCNPDQTVHFVAKIEHESESTCPVYTVPYSASLQVKMGTGWTTVAVFRDSVTVLRGATVSVTGDICYGPGVGVQKERIFFELDPSADPTRHDNLSKTSSEITPCRPMVACEPTPTVTPGGPPETDTPTPAPCSPDLDVRQVTVSCNPDQTVHFIAKVEHETESTCTIFTAPYTAILQVQIGSAWSTVAVLTDSVTVPRGATAFVTGDFCFVPGGGVQKERVFFALDPSADPTRGDNLSKTSSGISPCHRTLACP